MSGPTHKYGISTKLDLYTHQAVTEFANCYTSANLSDAMRELVAMGLAQAANNKKAPASFRLAHRNKERYWQKEYQQWLNENYVQLQNNYDAETEEMLKDFAKEKNLKYPPDVTQLKLWEVDSNLRKTLETVKASCNGSGETSLREVMRIASYTRETALKHLEKLRDFGQVQFEDTPEGVQCIIKLP